MMLPEEPTDQWITCWLFVFSKESMKPPYPHIAPVLLDSEVAPRKPKCGYVVRF